MADDDADNGNARTPADAPNAKSLQHHRIEQLLLQIAPLVPVSTSTPNALASIFERARYFFPRRMTKRPSPTDEMPSGVTFERATGFYVIDAAALQRPSRRPHHLAARFRSKTAEPRSAIQGQAAQGQMTEHAAQVLQAWWRRRKLGPAIRTWRRKGLKSAQAKEMSFDELAALLQTDLMVKVATSLIVRVKKMVGADLKMKNPARVFLGAFIIAAHPSETLGAAAEGDAAEVLAAATTLVHEFEGLVSGFVIGSFHSQLPVFMDAWVKFYDVFTAWKEADMAEMVDLLVAHWMELEQMWLTVKDQPGAEEEFRPNIERQQLQLYGKIRRLGAGALEKLRDAQIARRRASGEGEDAMPAEALESTLPLSAEALASSPQIIKSKRHRRGDSVTNMERLKDEAVDGSNAPIVASPPRLLQTQTAAAVAQSAADAMPPSPTKVAPIPLPSLVSDDVLREQLMVPSLDSSTGSQAAVLNNHALAHELVMNPEFELKAPKRSALEESVRSTVRKTFFDFCRASAAKGDYSPLLDVIRDVRESLLAMVSNPNGAMAVSIGDGLDMALIEQQIAKGAFEPAKTVAFALDKMHKLCAPVRDESIRAIAQIDDLVEQFARMTEVLEQMKLDLANFQLQQLRPLLKQQAVEYEQKKFAEALAAGSVSLERTDAWLAAAVRSAHEVASSRNPEAIDIPETQIKYEDVYNDALVELIAGSTPLAPETVPETLQLDAERLFDAQNELQAITIVAALLMVSKNIVDGFRRDEVGHRELRDTLFILLRDRDTTLSNLTEQVVATIQKSLERLPALPSGAKRAVSDEQRSMIAAMVDKTLSFKDAVFSMLSRRIQSHIKGQLATGVFRREALSSHGLELVSSEVEDLSRKLTFLARHNKEVFAQYYDAAIKAAMSV